MDYLDSLNNQQKEAVENTEGPMMIIAGAGSGKTRVLTYRIAYLIHSKNINPFNILPLTFTNKAAAEMRKRVQDLIGEKARNIWMGTFHSVFARILRSEASHIGYSSNFTIYDTADSKSLIKTIIKELALDDKLYTVNIVYGRISGAKNRLVSYQEYTSNPVYKLDDTKNRKPEIGKIYKLYCERCFKATAMDFDDLLFNTNILFRDYPDILKKYQNRFKYVMVDEFQDTNASQYLITKKISATSKNICVVGDDAQSIYAFRGADIQNILNFEKDYPALKVVKLEQNYRSTKNIVNAANCIISNNKSQLKKNVWTLNNDGVGIELIKCASDYEEGKLVATSIFEEKTQHYLHNLDFAILYRTKAQSRIMEESLRKLNIKYKIIGALSFYQRKEVKDVLAYMRFTLNTNDEESLKRIINLPKRGIGSTTVGKIITAANKQNISIWEALQQAKQIVPERAAVAILQFTKLIKYFALEIAKKDAYDAANVIIKESGLLQELYNNHTIEGISSYENVQELLNAVKEFVDEEEDRIGGDSKDKKLATFLQEITLLTSEEQDKDDDNDKVTLMTIHMAKGLEFKNVYIVGMEENLFPSQMMLNSRTDLEEERRLFYVAITRAKEKLFISYALNRSRFGKFTSSEPSRFIKEIDKQYIKLDSRFGERFKKQQISSSQYAKKLVSSTTSTLFHTPPANSHIPSDGFSPSNTSALAKGMKVEHLKFGFGKVIEIDNSGESRKAKIIFDSFGMKTLLLSFAKIKIH